jgi:hypothetical protein
LLDREHLSHLWHPGFAGSLHWKHRPIPIRIFRCFLFARPTREEQDWQRTLSGKLSIFPHFVHIPAIFNRRILALAAA